MFNDFNFQRTLLLIQKQWTENKHWYGYSVLALTGLLALIFSAWMYNSGPRYNAQFIFDFFFIGLFTSGLIFASFSFRCLSKKPSVIHFLTLPASALEKLICQLFYNVIVYTAVYCLCFYVVQAIASSYVLHLVEHDPIHYTFKELGSFHNYSRPATFLILIFFALQAVFILGSVYFKRYSLILTSIVVVVLVYSFMFFSKTLITMLHDGYGLGFNLETLHVYKSTGDLTQKVYGLNPIVWGILLLAVKFIWAPFFWVVTWFRLKEKQL